MTQTQKTTATPGHDLLVSDEGRQEIDRIAREYDVPGLQVGILRLDGSDTPQLGVYSYGVTSRSTGVEVTDDTIFQYGSIGKVWTTTLIMQLIDEGKLTLDTRVIDVLPDFALDNMHFAQQITVRHLLTHTSGIDGDVFTDTGDGDDCIEKYVAELKTAVSVTEPGGPLSYCNAGFVVAGRIVEVLRGSCWDDALREHIFEPLGLTEIITRAKDAPLHRTAVGHVGNPQKGAEPRHIPTTRWMLPRAMGPAGLITGSAGDLLRFAAAHLRDGVGLTGKRILSEDSARAMRELRVDLRPISTTEVGWGLGWYFENWDKEIAVTHSGATIGQISHLHMFPEHQLAFCVLTNSRGGVGAGKRIEQHLGAQCGLVPPRPKLESDVETLDLTPWLGTYESTAVRHDLVRDAHGKIVLASHLKEVITEEPDEEPQPVTPLAAHRLSIEYEGELTEVSLLVHNGKRYLFLSRLFEKTS